MAVRAQVKAFNVRRLGARACALLFQGFVCVRCLLGGILYKDYIDDD